MSELRIDFTEEQLRNFVKTVWDEAFLEGENRGMGPTNAHMAPPTCDEAWEYSLSRGALETLIDVGNEALRGD